jgi:hypothetical protein
MVEEEVQKVTWPLLPPVKEETESASQITLPDESVVSFPPLDWALQLYPLNWTAEETIKLLPTPTLPDKSDNPLTLNPPKARVRLLTIKELPIPTLPTRSDIPDTLRVVKAEAEVTVSDEPMATLPDDIKEVA